MSIQSKFNSEALDYVPRIKRAIDDADSFSSSQMQSKTISAMLNSEIAIARMDDTQLAEFEGALLTTFKFNKWL
jgi:hypothetical protein